MPTLLEKIAASAAERLPLPANSQPSQELARYKNFLKIESHRLKILHRAGAGGREICLARAAVLDVLLRSILEAVKHNKRVESKTAPPGFQDILPSQHTGGPDRKIVHTHEGAYQAAHRLCRRRQFKPLI